MHFDGVCIYTDCTSSFHGAYLNPFPRISSAGKALTSNGGSSFSDSLPIITPNTLLFYFNLTTLTFIWHTEVCQFVHIPMRIANGKCKNGKKPSRIALNPLDIVKRTHDDQLGISHLLANRIRNLFPPSNSLSSMGDQILYPEKLCFHP